MPRLYRVLIADDETASSLAEDVNELVVNELGYEPEEAIAGLVLAIAELAKQTSNPDAALDEAMDLLSDVEV